MVLIHIMNRLDKIGYLTSHNIITMNDIQEDEVDYIYQRVYKRENTALVDTNTSRYKLLLDLVNKLLVDMGKPEIDDLLKFSRIDRHDMMKCDKQIIIDMKKDLRKHFILNSAFSKVTATSYCVSTLRSLVKQMGLKFDKKKKSIMTHRANGMYKRTYTTVYFIENV